jgi:hypothetical protein
MSKLRKNPVAWRGRIAILGRCALMKTAFTILLLSLFFCGCVHTQTTSSGSTLDRIQAGKDISCRDYTLHIEKRDGSSIEGIRYVHTGPDGQTATATAARGTLSQGSDPSVIKMVLYDVHMEKVNEKLEVTEKINFQVLDFNLLNIPAG